jgi:hypothetical protein
MSNVSHRKNLPRVMNRRNLAAIGMVACAFAILLLAAKASVIIDGQLVTLSATSGCALAGIWFACTARYATALDPVAYAIRSVHPPHQRVKGLAWAAGAFVVCSALLGVFLGALSTVLVQRFASKPWNANVTVQDQYRMKGLFAGMLRLTVVQETTQQSFTFAWPLEAGPLFSDALPSKTPLFLRGRTSWLGTVVDTVQVGSAGGG